MPAEFMDEKAYAHPRRSRSRRSVRPGGWLAAGLQRQGYWTFKVRLTELVTVCEVGVLLLLLLDPQPNAVKLAATAIKSTADLQSRRVLQFFRKSQSGSSRMGSTMSPAEASEIVSVKTAVKRKAPPGVDELVVTVSVSPE